MTPERNRIAIICSGGDAPGMNAAIKKFVDYLMQRGGEPWFVYDGLEGLIDGNITKAGYSDAAGILHRGGAVIRSSRSKRFFEYSCREKAYRNLEKHGIGGLVVLGGDGSFRAMERFGMEFPLRFAGIPATIDNDIYGTDICIGVDSALNVIRDALDRIRDTAATISRAFVVEVMGRECGYLAVVSALTSGAEICIVPEVEFNREVVEKHLLKEIERGRRYILAVVAEGTGKSAETAKWLEESIGMETRITVLGHIQRGGSPTVADRMLAFEFAVLAVDHLLDGDGGGAVTVRRNGRYALLDAERVVNGRYRMDPSLLSGLNRLD